MGQYYIALLAIFQQHPYRPEDPIYVDRVSTVRVEGFHGADRDKVHLHPLPDRFVHRLQRRRAVCQVILTSLQRLPRQLKVRPVGKYHFLIFRGEIQNTNADSSLAEYLQISNCVCLGALGTFEPKALCQLLFECHSSPSQG